MEAEWLPPPPPRPVVQRWSLRVPRRLPCGWGAAVGVLLLLLYFGNERSFLHRSAIEKAFWPLIYGWFALLWVTCHSHKVAAAQRLEYGSEGGHSSELTDAAVVTMAALMGLAIYMHNRTQRLASSVSRRDLQQLAKPYVETVAARMAASRVSDLLSSRRSVGLLQGLVWELVDVLTGRVYRVRGSLLKALQECCKAGQKDLLYLLNCSDVDLPRLFTVAGTDGVLDLICKQVPHMDVVTKARLVDALHRQPDFKQVRRLQRPVVEILRQTRGRELTTLKNLIDEIGDFFNLHRLVFQDLVADFRQDVLQHLEEEGQKLRAAAAKDGRWAEVPRKILSDIDDTLYSSGGRFPAGVDARFDRGQVYPGVLALFRELDQQRPEPQQRSAGGAALGAAAEDKESVPLWFRAYTSEWEEIAVPGSETVSSLRERISAVARAPSGPVPTRSSSGLFGGVAGQGVAGLEVSFTPPPCRAMSNLVFLSARPHAYKDYVESRSFRLFRTLRARGSLHCMPTLLSGSLSASTKAAVLSAVIEFKLHLCVALSLLVLMAVAVHRRVLTALVLGLLVGFVCAWAATRQQRHASEAWMSVAKHKARTFLQYQQLYRECSTVFFGDNGQGDLWCGEQIARLSAAASRDGQPRPVAAVFIHEVAPQRCQLSSEKREEAWRKLGVHFHRTYVGAAVNAFLCGLVSQEALARVAGSAVDDLLRLRLGAMDGRGRAWAERVAELNTDVARANKLLPEELRVEEVPKAAGDDQPWLTRPHSRSLERFSFSTAAPEAVEGNG